MSQTKQCEAYNCPIPPSCCDDLRAGESSSWTCRWHHKTQKGRWGEVTHKITKVQSYIDNYFKLKRIGPQANEHDYQNTSIKESALKRQDEGHYEYLERLWEGLDNYILDIQSKPVMNDKIKGFIDGILNR